jgi:hypothetical protein
MLYEEPNTLAAALERAARRVPREQDAAALRLAAAVLRDDEIAASERQTQFLATLDPIQMIGVAALVLDQRGATGDENARSAAAHLHTAGLILTNERDEGA